ncbi:multidrug efflux SMR transporter [Thalassovita sp.]|uniref:DMT family transporter n=1 Tax=Thalassovita sp. TaxID=1979401 RepID=UPI002B2728EB|nr:multidrug efflux SMR transporter [Thalassovita sp.]
MHYIYLLLAILTETAGTMALQASEQFTRIGPTILVVLGYAASFYFMALVLKFMPVGIVYAIWSGVSIALIAAMGKVFFNQQLDLPAYLGIALILTGILVIQLFSKTATH